MTAVHLLSNPPEGGPSAVGAYCNTPLQEDITLAGIVNISIS